VRRVHVVGRRNQGKTTLVVELARALAGRGIRVGTIKHTSHDHELDTPGKDSCRHREASGGPAAIIAPRLVAAYLPRRDEADPYLSLAPLYEGCELILVEGNLDGPGPKVEVWRAAPGGPPPLATEREDIAWVVSDDPLPPGGGRAVPRLPRSDGELLATRILELARGG